MKQLSGLFNPRTALAFAHDIVAAGVAWLLAYWLRFNFEIPGEFQASLLYTLVWVVPLKASLFWGFGLYRGIWRYASLPDLKRLAFAVIAGALLVPAFLIMFRIGVVVPRAVLVLDPVLLLFMMGGSRLAYRAWKEHRLYGVIHLERNPVLVLGGGDAADHLVREMSRSREWYVVGVLDDNPAKHGRQLQGIRIFGSLAEVGKWAGLLGAQHAILAMPSASHSARRRVVERCVEADIQVMTVPAFEDLMSGRLSVASIRSVELDDLLGRDPVVLDDAGLHGLLTGQVVMVTGAGGSIGSELCRQIAHFKPGRLVFYEQGEFSLYRMEQEFGERFPEVPIACVVGDVKNRARLDQVFNQYRPSVVFHAAAYKHVPLMEQDNAWEAVRNNVLGTYTVASAAQDHGVGKFVLISTDKAVNPANVMGASKRLAEMVCQGLQGSLSPSQEIVSGTSFVMVRFGNVLGSTGSVIPKFQEQIAKGGPVTVTHPEITRYFMSIPEAAQLVLQAGLMGSGGEIFVLDMGEPVKIVDLARDMIRLSGFGEGEIKIEFTGLRPGEKLYEELLADDEHTMPTHHPKLRIAKARQVDSEWLKVLLAWLNESAVLEDRDVKLKLKHWVPEYTGD